MPRPRLDYAWWEYRTGAVPPKENGPCRVVHHPAINAGRGSLDGDGGAGALERGLGLLGGVLGDLLQHRLGRVVDQVLGLLEAERGQRAHLLDDLDLLVAGSLEDDVELVLLGSGLVATAAATGGRGGRDGHGSSSGDVERLLELLHEVGQLEEGHLLERVEQVRAGNLGHVSLLLGQSSLAASAAAVSVVSAAAVSSAGASAAGASGASSAGASAAGASVAGATSSPAGFFSLS